MRLPDDAVEVAYTTGQLEDGQEMTFILWEDDRNHHYLTSEVSQQYYSFADGAGDSDQFLQSLVCDAEEFSKKFGCKRVLSREDAERTLRSVCVDTDGFFAEEDWEA